MKNKTQTGKPNFRYLTGFIKSRLVEETQTFPIHSVDSSAIPPEEVPYEVRQIVADRRGDAFLCTYREKAEAYREKWKVYNHLFGNKSRFYKNLPEMFKEPLDSLIE